jgi:DNA polymerase III epsilon subunit-like protein
MNNLYIDIETTALIPKDADWRRDYRMFPRIVSIAWKLTGEHLNIDKHYIINQCGKPLPASAIRIHGITDDICESSKHFIRPVLREFIEDAQEADLIIGHSIYFDSSIIKANVYKLFGPDSNEAFGIEEALHKRKRIDIMRLSAKYCYGWSTLEKLHNKLFGCGFKAHDAHEDVNAVERCYLKLVELGVIKQLQKV